MLRRLSAVWETKWEPRLPRWRGKAAAFACPIVAHSSGKYQYSAAIFPLDKEAPLW